MDGAAAGSMEGRPRFGPTATCETFRLPDGLTPDIPAADYAGDPRAVATADAARHLAELRDCWLNPPEWTESALLGSYAEHVRAEHLKTPAPPSRTR